MTRIEGVPQGRMSWWMRLACFFARKKLGKVPTPMQLFAHSPPVFFAGTMFEMGAEKLDAATAQVRHLVELRVAGLVGCPF